MIIWCSFIHFNIEMAKFFWFFALLCVQLSRGEEEILEIDNPVKGEALEKGQKSGEIWTDEDEKWFEEIQNLLTGDDSDEDYNEDYEEFGKLLSDIEELMKEHHPDKSNYLWLEEIGKWFTDEDEDYKSDESDSNESFGDIYNSWLYGKNSKKEENSLRKRFSSV